MQETAEPVRVEPVAAPKRPLARDPLLSLAKAPALSWLAALGAIASLVINRLLVRALNGQLPHGDIVQLARWGTFTRNLAGIACVGALVAVLVDLARVAPPMSFRRRVMLGAFGGGSALVGALAIFLPAHRWNLAILLVATATAHVLAVLFAATGAQTSSTTGLRISAGLLASSALLALLSLVVAVVGPGVGWLEAPRAASALRRMGELLYLALPLALGAALFPRREAKRGLASLALGVFVAVAVFLLFLYARARFRADFETLLYGTYRLELMLGTAPLLYAAPLSLGFGVCAMGLVAASPGTRQAAIGLVLLLAAGYAPRTAGHLLMLALGAGLLLRTAFARGGEPPIAPLAFSEDPRPPPESA